MKAQLVSEVRKLTSTRTVYWFAIGAIALMVMSVLSISGQPATETSRPFNEQQFVFLSTFVKLIIVVVGIKMMTDEYRHGTATPTFTHSPRRAVVVGAKAIVAAGAGITIAAISMAVLVGTALGVFALNGHELVFGAGGLRAVAGGVLAGGLWAVIGAGIGAIVRNQVIAIVAALVWLMAIEEVIRPRLGDLGNYLPAQGGFMLSMGISPRALWLGAGTMLAYAAVATAAGMLVSRRIDIA